MLLSAGRGRRPAFLVGLVICALAVPGLVRAQTVFHATPSLSVSQQYDSNLFSSAAGRDRDFFTRVSSALESTWDSQLWNLKSRYLLDMERFDRHPALTSMDARQQAALEFGYRPTPRLAWTANADFWKTRTPGELNQANGLALMRAAARRVSARVSVLRQINVSTTETLEYTQTRDQLTGGTGATTHEAIAGIERRRSPRTNLRVNYRVREFLFGVAGVPASHTTAHAVTLGLTRALSPRTRLSLDAGPRFSAASTTADLRGSIAYQGRPSAFSLSYARSQTTVIGLAGVADTQSVTAMASWPVWSSLRIRIVPGVFLTDIAGARATASVLGVALTRPVAHDLALDLGLDTTLQHGSVGSLATTSIARHVVAVRLIAGSSTFSR